MTEFYLIRHGANETVGNRIAGRAPAVSLNAEGREQARQVAERLAEAGIGAVYSSPMERTRETAEAIASRTLAPLHVLEELNEVDFGDWTGSSFELLEKDPRWRLFNAARSLTRVPGGELMIETQARMVTTLQALRERHPEERIAVVSHGDPIRTALIYYTGIPMDSMHRIEVDLASVSIVSLAAERACVRCINCTGRF